VKGKVVLERASMRSATVQMLSRGGWGNPDVFLVDGKQGRCVVKDFSPRSARVRRWLAPWLLRREERAYRRLEGLVAVPRLLGRVDEEALVFEYRPGVLLSRSLAGHLSPEFVPELEDAVREMHRRGVVHLDLRHRSNILAGRDGHPVLLDFASALRFDPSTRWGRAAVALLGWIDRRAVDKWRVRLI